MSNYAFLNYFPPIFLLTLFTCSYYIYVLHYCFGAINIVKSRIFFITLLNICSAMLLWSFIATMCSSVGDVPVEYKFNKNQHKTLLKSKTEDEKDNILESFADENNLLLFTCTPTGSIRYCINCMLIKPDRAHHCSTCKTCYLKMDHHCPWINNCIGYLNYKSFVLLILYTFLYCFYYVISTTFYLLYTLENLRYELHVPICVAYSFAVIIGLITFVFFWYHIYLVCRNETTLENVHNPTFIEDDLTFDLGTYQNVIEVFGDKWYLWFLPVFSSMGCGHLFTVGREIRNDDIN